MKKKKENKLGALDIEVLLWCTETITIECESSNVMIEIDLWDDVLQKLDEIPLPSNPCDNNKNNMGNTNMEDTKKDGLDGENSTVGTECCLTKIEKLAVPARVVLMQSVHCMNDRSRDSNVHKGNGADNVGAHGEAMTASSIMDIA